MIPDYCPISPNNQKFKVIYGWYIYAVYTLLIFNIYLAVYNVCVRYPIESPMISWFHSLFIAFILYQLLKKRTRFAWLMLAYFILMRLYYANILHIEFNSWSRGLVFVILTVMFTGTVALGQLATPPLRQDWLARLGWRQWATLACLSGILTPLITTDYLG
ncbi:hypothetical protein ACUTSW_02015 [Serratia sp. TSA_198.1]|uniref:hypothetical protein n=1 Tax=Serratia sp. TSA_198.1 TaxID=3415664 RepID=UPI0040461448